MTKIRTIYTGNLHCEAEHLDSGVKIVTSAPRDNQGEGDCFSPTDLFAASLGCCMLTIMGIAARTHGFSVDGTEITTEKVMASGPRRVAELHLQIRFPKEAHYSDKQKAIIENAAHTCPVGNSLSPDLKEVIEFIY